MKTVATLPHLAFSHLLPLEETGEGQNDLPSPALLAGEGARRAVEGSTAQSPSWSTYP